MLLNRLKELKSTCTKEQYKMIVESVDQDVNFNIIGFGKYPSSKQLLDIVNITAGVVLATLS